MTPEQHYKRAEALLEEAQEVYDELKAVPIEGVKFMYTTPTGSQQYISKSQDTIRDNLGKKIAGLNAAAHVHAVLSQTQGEWTTYPYPVRYPGSGSTWLGNDGDNGDDQG